MTVKCEKCPMNEKCICIPSSDECFVRKQSYNKAIDEFVKIVHECSGYTSNCIEHDLCLTVYTIHQIAEQMKGGVTWKD